MPFEPAPQVKEQVVQPADQPMKLSAGIRIGCVLAPAQCFGTLFDTKNGVVRATCALGAYALANGIRHGDDEAIATLFAPFPDDLKFEVASDWNDTKHLSREEIADRLEQRGF